MRLRHFRIVLLPLSLVLCASIGVQGQMSIRISKLKGSTRIGVFHLAEDSWDLPKLFSIFEAWLQTETTSLDPTVQWIADIGFSPREGANGGGPIISTQMMQLCIKRNIAIYLSEYNDLE